MSIRLVHPCPGATLTDRFGWRAAIPGVVGPQLHTGQDFAAPFETPIRAMHSGRVSRTWWDTFVGGAAAGGNMIEIGAAQCVSRYAHLSRYAVSPGDAVTAGQIIGYMGATGAATGVHLHAELLIGGQFVDLVPYLTATPTARPGTPNRAARRRLRKKGRNKMIFGYLKNGAGKAGHRYCTYVQGSKGTWWEFTGQEAANALATQLGNPMPLSAETWAERKRAHS